MHQTYRKKLIEVALPLEAINKESAREKSIRHGHPSTLHLWWARRPLAACRAVLFASLVDDPDSDPTMGNWAPAELGQRRGEKRQQLFDLIEELVKWENSNNEDVIRSARAEIARCVASRKIETGELQKDQALTGGITAWDLVVKGHARPVRSGKEVVGFEMSHLPQANAVNAFLAEHAPPVLDPFCGGGSIPLEAQRLGLRAYASDLNPVPVLITKALIEIPPKFANKPPVNPEARNQGKLHQTWKGAQGLAEDVRYYGKWMRDEAEKRIGHLYPKVEITAEMAKDRPDLKPYVGEQLTVIAWLWARTVPSPNPAVAGAHVPLVRSFLLSTRKGNEAWVDPIIDRRTNTYQFKVRIGKPAEKGLVDAGTKLGRGCKFRCLLSDEPIPESHIKEAGTRGELSTRMLAVVVEGPKGRIFLSPHDAQVATAASVPKPKNVGAIEAPLANDPRNLWCLAYGLDHFDKLFTHRQLTALVTFSDLVAEARERVLTDAKALGTATANSASLDDGGTGPRAYADAVATYLAEAVSKLTVFHNTLTRWRSGESKSAPAFGRQAIPMVWDFPEVLV